jgi:lipopolysaccharide export system protein LptA
MSAGRSRQAITTIPLPATLLTILVILTLTEPARALPQDASQPIQIRAEHLETDQNAGTAVYTGSVEAQQGTMRVSADEMTVQVENRKVIRITARGTPARYQQLLEADKGLVKANARTIVYHTQGEQVDLQGDAFLEQGGNEIAGELIHYDIVAGKVNAQAGDQEPVRVILQPANRSE